jgi:hypothetical protein
MSSRDPHRCDELSLAPLLHSLTTKLSTAGILRIKSPGITEFIDLYTFCIDYNFAGLHSIVPLSSAHWATHIMVPLSSVSTAGMAKGRESGPASALFNMMGNIGGSLGIAGLRHCFL